MKKFFTTLALALLTLAASAQENPNRVIVKQKYKAPSVTSPSASTASISPSWKAASLPTSSF